LFGYGFELRTPGVLYICGGKYREEYCSDQSKLFVLDRAAEIGRNAQYCSNNVHDTAETLIPDMKETIDRAADLGVENIVIGMPQRQAELMGFFLGALLQRV
jgi:hypothetical protein